MPTPIAIAADSDGSSAVRPQITAIGRKTYRIRSFQFSSFSGCVAAREARYMIPTILASSEGWNVSEP